MSTDLIQTIIVAAIVCGAGFFLIRTFFVKKNSGCGCGCGCGCGADQCPAPNDKRDLIRAEEKAENRPE